MMSRAQIVATAALLAAGLVPSLLVAGAPPLLEGRLEPVQYLGPRNDEPLFQTLALARFRSGDFANDDGWFLDGQVQAELLGTRQWLPDLNRAGYRNGRMILGRVHPWEVLTGHPEADRPWGLAAQTQALNLGVELGYERTGEAFREPILGGWLGIHLASSTDAEAPLAVSLSATPFFLPTLGGQVRFSETEPAQATRFGRTPPTRVELGGLSYPLFYRIDTSDLVEEVLLQPQLLIQGRYRTEPVSPDRIARLTAWVWLLRAPSPDPVPDANGVLLVDETGVSAMAEVKPTFPQRWQLGFSQVLEMGTSDVRSLLTVLTDLDAQDLGIEAGVEFHRTRASILHRFANPSVAEGAGFAAGNAARFDQAMLQIETAVAGEDESWIWSGGVKAQLGSSGSETQSVWLATALDWRLAPTWTLRLAADLFGGADGTFFGDWRTNDRISATASWAL
jgi:hypothetical protein